MNMFSKSQSLLIGFNNGGCQRESASFDKVQMKIWRQLQQAPTLLGQ